jgi:hypothetical protein
MSCLSACCSLPRHTSPNSPPPIIASMVMYRGSSSLANCRTAWVGDKKIGKLSSRRKIHQIIPKNSTYLLKAFDFAQLYLK